MKLTAQTWVEAPKDRVFAGISDIRTLESLARERGAEVTRLDGGADGPAGAEWRLLIPLHGRARAGTARVTAYEPDDRIAIAADLDGVTALAELVLAATGPGRTTMEVDIHLSARTLGGRLLVQPLKLARGGLEERLSRRIDAFARRIEAGQA